MTVPVDPKWHLEMFRIGLETPSKGILARGGARKTKSSDSGPYFCYKVARARSSLLDSDPRISVRLSASLVLRNRLESGRGLVVTQGRESYTNSGYG
jgi:hypothetical protein